MLFFMELPLLVSLKFASFPCEFSGKYFSRMKYFLSCEIVCVRETTWYDRSARRVVIRAALDRIALNNNNACHNQKFASGQLGFRWYNIHHIDGLVQERRNSTANALELQLSCTNPTLLHIGHYGQTHLQMYNLTKTVVTITPL